LLAAAPLIQSVWHRPRPDAPLVLLAGTAAIQESWQDEDLDLSGAVFLQVNREAAQLLEDYVMEVVGDVSGRKLLDLYCGVGLHARRFARMGAQVVGVELDELAIEEARAAHVENAEFVCGRAEEELPRHLPADVVILNPPRAGRMGATYRIASIRCFDLFPQTAHVETVVELTCATS
jgi:23S rRNA (uracil1939-C5)-methyltransferase